jgi:flagellar protein FliS
MYGNNAYSQYKTNSVNFASKDQLLLMLLDGAVKFAKIGRQAICDGNVIKANDNLKKTQNIFYELIYSLDLNLAGEWGQKMVSVYKFIINRLMQANIKKDIAIMDEVIPLIEDVKNLWNETYQVAIKSR